MIRRLILIAALLLVPAAAQAETVFGITFDPSSVRANLAIQCPPRTASGGVSPDLDAVPDGQLARCQQVNVIEVTVLDYNDRPDVMQFDCHGHYLRWHGRNTSYWVKFTSASQEVAKRVCP